MIVIRNSKSIIHNSLFLILFAVFLFVLFPMKTAMAALILQAPKYIGLNSDLAPLEVRCVNASAPTNGGLLLTGLVGYWSFNTPDLN